MISAFTDDEIIVIANRLIENNKYVSRSLIRQAAQTSDQRLQRLEDAGKIKLPKKVPKSCGHLFHREKKWRNFRLPNSPQRKD